MRDVSRPAAPGKTGAAMPVEERRPVDTPVREQAAPGASGEHAEQRQRVGSRGHSPPRSLRLRSGQPRCARAARCPSGEPPRRRHRRHHGRGVRGARPPRGVDGTYATVGRALVDRSRLVRIPLARHRARLRPGGAVRSAPAPAGHRSDRLLGRARRRADARVRARDRLRLPHLRDRSDVDRRSQPC